MKAHKIELYEGLYVRSGTQDRAMVRDALFEDYPYAELADHVVLDCGAHVGGFVKRALDNGAKKVIAIEPWRPNREILEMNFLGNPLVEILPIALSTSPSVTLTVPNDSSTGAVSGYVNHRNPAITETVEAMTLEAIVEVVKPTFIKMDIEAAEYDILPCNLGGVQHICGELHTMSRENRKKALELLIWLEENDFYVTYIKSGPMREKMFERVLWMNFHAWRRK